MDNAENLELNYCYNCMTQLGSGQTVCPACGHDNSLHENPDSVLPAGTILSGKYLVGRVLGQGGFGITYLGFDTALEVRVAIKEYFPYGIGVRTPNSIRVTSVTYQGRPESFRMGCDEFRAEAKRLAAIESPNIVKVRDYFRENGTAYIVMSYLDGNSLTKEAADCGGRIPWQRVTELFRPLILEMDKLHADQLIHRDIKPDNLKIIKDKNGMERLVLLDFGNARSFVSAEVTGTYTAALTPGYAPVEQYSRKARQGPYTDIYALCATMYACITGTRPPEANDRILGLAEVPSFSELGIDVPENVEKAVMHGLVVRSDDRTQSMLDLYRELYAEEQPREGNTGTVPSNEEKIGLVINTGKQAAVSDTDQVPDSAPASMPVSAAIPAAVPAPAPAAVFAPAPTSIPPLTPAAVSPAPASVPATTPAAASAPIPASVPAPAAVSSPAAIYAPTPASASAPIPASVHAPAPAAVSSPAPASIPVPTPAAAPAQAPAAVPAPIPASVPAYAPTAVSAAVSASNSAPVHTPIRAAVPEADPAPAPAPASKPDPKKWIFLLLFAALAAGWMLIFRTDRQARETIRQTQTALQIHEAQIAETLPAGSQTTGSDRPASALPVITTVPPTGTPEPSVTEITETALPVIAADLPTDTAEPSVTEVTETTLPVIAAVLPTDTAEPSATEIPADPTAVPAIAVEVTITGHKSIVNYDGREHSVTGYDAEISDPRYTAADFSFTGTDTAIRRNTGTTKMGLHASQFRNTNPDFDQVTFIVIDGYQTITPIDVYVTIIGHRSTVEYDGWEHRVSGYDTETSDPLYSEGDFSCTGPAQAARTEEGTTYMGLSPSRFENNNSNFRSVTFFVTDGYLTIRPAPTRTPVPVPTNTPKPNLRVGDVITMGHYEQDNKLSNGPEAIKWQVLKVEDGRALVASKYGLDAIPFNERYVNVTWETCSLRKWLNGEFYNNAFSSEEKGRILQVTLNNPNNPVFGTKGGNSTKDRIFLLSINEAEHYYRNDEARKCWATDYAKANGAWISAKFGTTWCWLRSPGIYAYDAANIVTDGYVNENGIDVNDYNGVVRPVFWLDL